MTTREAWLNEAAEALAGEGVYTARLPRLRISCGFPGTGARSARIGECWYPEASADGTTEIFIHPKLATGVEVLAVLAHELIHATQPGDQHGPKFKRTARAFGLDGPCRSTVPGPLFTDYAEGLVRWHLGPYPHGVLAGRSVSSGPPKQTTRMLKLQCPGCGYTVRAAQSWIDQALPLCGLCYESNGGEPLINVLEPA